MKKLLTLTILLSTSALFCAVGLVLGVLCSNLNSVKVYPNPFEPKLGHTSVMFDNLTASARIKIYKKTGELIYEKVITTTDGHAAWDVTTNGGTSAASGIYIYAISSGGYKTTGKIAVIK